MNFKTLFFWGAFLLLFTHSSVKSQSTFVSSGKDISGTGGTISYSIGQVAYSSVSGANGYLIEGVQQPYEIYTITGTEDFKNIVLDFMAYPNPATNILNLKVENYSNQRMSYQLISQEGRLLKQNEIQSITTEIQVSDLAASTYFLKILLNQENVKIFKIIKH